jgi:hypothetical protein
MLYSSTFCIHSAPSIFSESLDHDELRRYLSRKHPSFADLLLPHVDGKLLLDLEKNDVPIEGAFSENSVVKKASILRLKVLLKTLLSTVKPGKVKKSISLFPNQKTGISAGTVSRPR